MSSAHLLRLQIEAALSDRIPSALTPAPRVIRPTAPTGIAELDERLGGGLPMGAISELAGPECSGRTSLALSFVAGLTQAGRVCAWVDVSDALDPESAAACGVDLERLLWVRCGAAAEQISLPGFGEIPVEKEKSQGELNSGSHAHGAEGEELQVSFAPRCAEPQPRVRRRREALPVLPVQPCQPLVTRSFRQKKPWSRLDQALRATDLLLQAGGFSAIVLDMGSIAPEYAMRVPLATWFRYRAAAERTQASVLLLTQQVCTKSSAGLVLHLEPERFVNEGGTVFTGAEYRVEIARERFGPVREFERKPPQSERGGTQLLWQSHAAWAGRDERGSR